MKITREEYIAQTAAILAAAQAKRGSIYSDDCVKYAVELADNLEKNRLAPWQIPAK